jgi:hypothetical protein
MAGYAQASPPVSLLGGWQRKSGYPVRFSISCRISCVNQHRTGTQRNSALSESAPIGTPPRRQICKTAQYLVCGWGPASAMKHRRPTPRTGTTASPSRSGLIVARTGAGFRRRRRGEAPGPIPSRPAGYAR